MAQLNNDVTAKLLDEIDHLRRLGIDRYISLPQIVVVGQQASGKSSCLEAISGISFSANDGKCTRFATEVKLRHDSRERAKVTIITDKATTSAEYLDQTKEFENTEVALENIPDLINRASQIIGIGDTRGFSNDKLSIEVWGPKQANVTLVDLPGLFSAAIQEKDEADKTSVRCLVESYMKMPSTIVLAVVSGKTDPENQEVLEMLRAPDIDPHGHRTIGVITGVDKIEAGSYNE